jgi:hypothetical protein
VIVGEVFESVGEDDDVVDTRVIDCIVDWVIDEVVGMVWLDISEPGSVKLRPGGELVVTKIPVET